MIPEQDRKNDTTKISHRADCSAQNTISMRMDVRHERKIRPVARFQKRSHASDEAEHLGLIVWVRQTDGDEEDAGCYADEVDPGFLQPEVLREVVVEEIAYDAAEGSVRESVGRRNGLR